MVTICIDSDKDDVIKYAGLVKKNAKEREERIVNSFGNFMQSKKGYKKKIVFTTGSDGRLENNSHEGIKSNMEFIVTEDEKLERNYPLARSSEELCEVIKKNVSFIIDNIEIKRVGKDRLSLFENDGNLIFPTRIWDSLPIWGNNDLYNTLRRQVSQEILENPKFNEYFQKRLAVHKRATKNGFSSFKGNTSTQIDFNNGIIHYDPQNHNEGVKYGPLRVIQYSLALSLLRKIRNIGEHPAFIEYLPSNILDRIDFLIDNNLTKLSKNEAENIKYIYAYFLKIYHQIQFEYSFKDKKEFLLNKDDFQDIREMLNYLAESFSVDKLII